MGFEKRCEERTVRRSAPHAGRAALALVGPACRPYHLEPILRLLVSSSVCTQATDGAQEAHKSSRQVKPSHAKASLVRSGQRRTRSLYCRFTRPLDSQAA